MQRLAHPSGGSATGLQHSAQPGNATRLPHARDEKLRASKRVAQVAAGPDHFMQGLDDI